MTNQQRQQLYCDALQKSLTPAININALINLKIGTNDKTVLTFNRRLLFNKYKRSVTLNNKNK